MKLKDAFLDFFHFNLPLKEQIKNSEMPVVFVDFGGEVFKEHDRVTRYSWEAQNGSWVYAYLIPNKYTIYICNNKFEKYVKRGLLVTINTKYYQYKINSNLIPYLSQNEFNDINSFAKSLIESIEKSLTQEKSKEEKVMSKTNETNYQCRAKVINHVEVSNHIVNDSLVVEEIDMLHMIDHVILNAPATIVFWKDGTKTVIKCKEDDVYDPEKGIAMAFTKKVLGNNYNYINKFNTIMKKAKKVDDDSKAKITFKNNKECSECETCICDPSMKSNISIETAAEITRVLGGLADQIVEIRKEIDELKSKKKKKN